jgi:phospholipase C
MRTRRQFIQEMALIASAAGAHEGLLSSIRRAAAIEPEPGSTFEDAEHVVILMQENRSFDHAFGTLRGVRGFDDPRAIELADGNPVWIQANAKGERYSPFRLDIHDTKTTWMGCLPHGWGDQVDAANKGLHDRWLNVKRSGNREYADMPLTMGYYDRKDIPFYYELADAFTICDQNYCSTLTGTTPNRLHLWTGTCRRDQKADAQAVVWNQDCDYGVWANWPTFPERLEDHGISWKIYQNELTVPTGLSGEADSWVGNFGCNPIEWFEQYHVRFHDNHHKLLQHSAKSVAGEIASIESKIESETGAAKTKLASRLESLKASLVRIRKDLIDFDPANFEKLSPREKSLYARAFVTNAKDPNYRDLEPLVYQAEGEERRLNVPKGDVLHQFREDVRAGSLPAVSWIVPAGSLSDHPSYAWFGQWYLSEVLNILTSNPEVWKKTVFILTYDENDGYYDHIPPFQAPAPGRPETGKASAGLDTSLEYMTIEQDRKYKPKSAIRDNSLGLGFRVPMIIASPWSRGGNVCSQVFDHTSVIRFVEEFAKRKFDKPVHEPNISDWRRTVCGDLTAAFRPAADNTPGLKNFIDRDPFIESIHSARFKSLPTGFHALSEEEMKQVRAEPGNSVLPRQEPGTRPSCALPYELAADAKLDAGRKQIQLKLEARNTLFGPASAGSAFTAYAWTREGLKTRNYAVAAGGMVEDSWPIDLFGTDGYRIRVHGPNGFFREFKGDVKDPQARIEFDPMLPHGKRAPVICNEVGVLVDNRNFATPVRLLIQDESYGNEPTDVIVAPGERRSIAVDISRSSGWYDFSVTSADSSFICRFAGRLETGQWGTSDPAIGRTAAVASASLTS